MIDRLTDRSAANSHGIRANGSATKSRQQSWLKLHYLDDLCCTTNSQQVEIEVAELLRLNSNELFTLRNQPQQRGHKYVKRMMF